MLKKPNNASRSPVSILVALVLSLWITLLACCTCRAEEQPITRLSLADAVARALGANVGIKQAEEGRLSSLSSLRIAGLTTSYGIGSMTSIERNQSDSGVSGRAFGNLTYENILGSQASLELSPFALGNERNAVALTLRHPLFSGKGAFSNKADLLAGARSDATIQEKQFYLTRQATVIGVVEAYYRAVLARDQIDVQEQAAAIAEEALTGAQKRAAEGLVAGIDVSRAEIRVAQMKNQLNIRKQAAQAAKDRLMYAIGSGVGQDPELTDSVPDTALPMPALAEAIETALANRTELSVYDEQIADQNRRLAIAQDQLRAQLDVVAGFNSVDRDEGLISGSVFGLGTFRAGLEYRFPLDKRIGLENRYSAARQLELLGRLRVFQMEELAQQVRGAYRDVETSRTSLEILSQNVQVARDNLGLAQRMVEEGLDDNRNVLEAQDALTQVESGLRSAKTELYLAGVNLRLAMGEDLAATGWK